MEKQSLTKKIFYTERDIVRLNYRVMYWSFSGVLRAIIFAALLIVGILSFVLRGFSVSALLMVLVGTGFHILLPFLILVGAKRSLSSNSIFTEGMLFTFSKEGVRSKSSKSDYTIEWSRIMKVVEAKKHFYIYHDEKAVYMVPKNQLDADDCVIIRELVKENMNKRQYKVRA